MRRLGGMLAVAALAVPAAAQDRIKTFYWAERTTGFPVNPEVLELKPRPAKVRLYLASRGGPLDQVAERAVDDLQSISKGRVGFQHTAREDGEVDVALQLVYPDGRVSPPTESLQPSYRVVFDSRPPVVSLVPGGVYGVEWTVQDENLDPASVRLECRWAGGDPRWYEVGSPRSGWAARDAHTWASLRGNTGTLEVRVTAKDKAGHEAVSRVVRLPARDGAASGSGRDDDVRARPGDADTRLVRGDDAPGQPQIVYSNDRNLTLKSKLTAVTRSGVQKVHLWVKDMTDSAAGKWDYAKEYPCNIPYQAADPAAELAYTVPKDGRFGFIVIPESGAGRKDADPRPTSLPQYLVEVITTKPYVKITNITVSPGGAVGPRVEVEWDAKGKLLPEPIVLEYAPSKTAEKWTPIAERLANSRRYVWEVSDKTVYKFYVRARVVDKATNTSEDVYEKEVNIDLDKPAATIEGVRPGGGGPEPVESQKPAQRLQGRDPPPVTPTARPGGADFKPSVTAPAPLPPVGTGR